MASSLIINLVLIVLGFALLKYGADFLVNGASSVAKKLGIPSIIIGLTIVSIGTSMPELMVSVNAAMGGHSDLSLGNVIGSNIANMLLILGVCALIHPLPFQKDTAKVDTPIMLGFTVILFLFGNFFGGKVITRMEGIVLLLLTASYIVYNVVKALRSKTESEAEIEEMPVWQSLVYMAVGIVGLKFGGDFVCDNAVAIATAMGISEKLIGVTIVSFATSLPELVTSLTATKKGDVDIAIGNIIGSNIFNICLIIGTSAAISPITYSLAYNYDFIFLFAASILLTVFPFIKNRYEMTRTHGIIYLVLYIIFIVYSIMKG